MKDEVRRRQQQTGDASDDLSLELGLADPDQQKQIQDLPQEQQELYVPATGAKITFIAAKQRLYYFCDKLPSDK